MAVGFGHTGDQVDHEHRQQGQPVPGQEVQTPVGEHALVLTQHDLGQVHAARDHDHHEETEAHGDFIAHHLGRRTQCAQEGVLGVRCPAGNDHPIHLDGSDGHHQQQASVEVGQRDFRTEGNRHPGSKRRHDGHDRAQTEQTFAGGGRVDQLLGQQLERVGDRLQQSERTHTVGAHAHLHETQQLALPQRQVGHSTHQRGQHGHDLEQDPDHGPRHRGPPGIGQKVQAAVVQRVDHATSLRASAVCCSEAARRTMPSSW